MRIKSTFVALFAIILAFVVNQNSLVEAKKKKGGPGGPGGMGGSRK